jgi:hypothetical protein
VVEQSAGDAYSFSPLAGWPRGYFPSPQTLNDLKSLYQGFRVRLTPQLQLLKILGGNVVFAQSFKQVVTKKGWEVRPLNFRHSCSKRLARQSFLEVLPITSARSRNQAFGKFKKAALFVFLGFESSLDQLFQYLIGASVFAFRKALDLAIDLGPQGDACGCSSS